MALAQISLAIVGAAYPNKRGPTRRFDLALCNLGEPLELRPEPTNPADEHAIAVFSERDVQLGYVKSERAPMLLKRLREGVDVRCVFQGSASFGGWMRCSFDGSVPVLPEVVAVEEGEPDWWPDEIPVRD